MASLTRTSPLKIQAVPPVAVPPPIPVEGQRCEFESAWHPVIVNREAEAEALMAWGVSQLEVVNQLLEAVASSPSATDAPGLARAVGHLTFQAETVLRTALQVHRDSFMA